MTIRELKAYKPKGDKLIEDFKQSIKAKFGKNVTRQQILNVVSIMNEYDLFEVIQFIHYLRDLEMTANCQFNINNK